MTRIYHPNMDFLILDECYADNDTIDPDALMGLSFKAPAPTPPGYNATYATLHYNGITRPPLGPDGLPDDSLPSLQVRVLTGELDPSDIKIVSDLLDNANSDGDYKPRAAQALRAN